MGTSRGTVGVQSKLTQKVWEKINTKRKVIKVIE